MVNFRYIQHAVTRQLPLNQLQRQSGIKFSEKFCQNSRYNYAERVKTVHTGEGSKGSSTEHSKHCGQQNIILF